MRTDVAAARAFVRSRGRRSRRRMSLLDMYVLGFAVVLGGVMLAGPVRQIAARLGAVAPPVHPAGGLPGLALLVAAGLGVYAHLLSVGPIVVTPADARGLVLSPLGRRAVLTRPAVALLLVSLIVGAGAGVLGVAMMGAVAHLLASAVVGAALTVAASSLGVLAQPVEAAMAWLRGLTHAGMLLVAMLALVAVLTPRALQGLVVLDSARLRDLSCVSVAFAALLAGLAWRRLARFPAATIAASAHRVGAGVDAVVGLEPRSLVRIAERAYWRGRRLRSRRWPRLPAPWAVAWQEWRALGRRPARLLLLAAGLPVPALLVVDGGGPTPLALVALLSGAGLAALAAVTGVRHEADHPSLARLLATTPQAVLAVRSLLPVLVCASWASGALLTLQAVGALRPGLWWLFGPATAPALAAGALRMARRRPIAHTSTPIVLPHSGTWVPSGWIIWIYSGLNIAALGTAPLIRALTTQPSTIGVLLAAQTVTSLGVLVGYLALAQRRPNHPPAAS